MERFAMDALRAWKNRRNRKPLVMRGARQVGKTWLVRKLAETEFESLLEVNFEQTPGAAALFASNDPAKILPLLAAQFGQRVEPGRTLLFLDEVQAAPQVLLSLRYFYEKLPALHVVAAGSLLEFALADHSFSMPVGRIEYFFLDPMTFGEFLCASGREALWGFLRSWRGADDFPAPIHDDCMELLRRYLAVGGMPESVAAFLDGGADFEASERARQGVLSTFADDFAKYSRRVPVENVRKVFESVPRQLGEKFTWAKVDREVRSAGLAAALDLLDKRMVTDQLVLHVGYDEKNLAPDKDGAVYEGEVKADWYGKTVPKPAHATVNLKSYTSSPRVIREALLAQFDASVNPALLVRRLFVTVNHVIPEEKLQEKAHAYEQLDMFAEEEAPAETEALLKERRAREAMLKIKKKFGKNAILMGLNMEEGATGRDRNAQIGGHKA